VVLGGWVVVVVVVVVMVVVVGVAAVVGVTGGGQTLSVSFPVRLGSGDGGVFKCSHNSNGGL
jgi:hypothetical protein